MAETLRELLAHIEENAREIYVRERWPGVFITNVAIAHLPGYLAIKHAFRLIRKSIEQAEAAASKPGEIQPHEIALVVPRPVPAELRTGDKRVWPRAINHRQMEDAGTCQVVTLECEHSTIQVIPIPDRMTEMLCTQCVNEFLQEKKKERADAEAILRG